MTFLLLLLAAAPLCPAPHRSKATVRQFIAEYREAHEGRSCPLKCATFLLDPKGRYRIYRACGACQVDHKCPLACGGVDASDNLQWLTARENRQKGADCSACKGVFYYCGGRR